MKHYLKVRAAIIAIALTAPIASYAADRDDVRLVLQITVDGLRADLIERYREGFGSGGFRYLLDNGVVYRNAHYLHANTETIVGHTTLATGAHPASHGMIGNAWLDRETGELGYNIEDAAYPLLPSRTESLQGERVDPAQKAARSQGRSPRAILAPTFSDTLMAYTGGRSRVFSVSGKDRGAVPLAGQVGKAFWWSTDTGDFVTSRYYYPAYPEWAAQWNAQRKAASYAGKYWNLLAEPGSYVLAHQDDRAYEVDLRGYGKVFPHQFGSVDSGLLFTQLLVSPRGDELTLDFAKTLVTSEGLGSGSALDYLAISFSGVDAVNHFFGPSSLENEDMVRHLDRTLADLLAFIDKSVGLKHTLIVLSADHGMAEMPEYMAGLGLAASRLDPQQVLDVANQAGKRLFNINDIALKFFRPYLYLDTAAISRAGLDQQQVTEAMAGALSDLDGIALAQGPGERSQSPEAEQIRRNRHPARSGDIYIAQQPYWFLFAKGPVAAMHGSPWRYDTHVPIIFAGPGLVPGEVERLVHPVDVAPTLSAFLGMSAPAAAQGQPLVEVLRNRD